MYVCMRVCVRVCTLPPHHPPPPPPQSPDGKLIASGAIDGIINLFDLQTGRLLHTLEGQ